MHLVIIVIKLFLLPTKSNFGLLLDSWKAKIRFRKLINKIKKISDIFGNNYVNPGINYIDFNEGIRNREDLRKIIYKSIMDLKNRKIVEWIDIDKIWERHIYKKANHADALLVLAWIELHLKSGKEL